MRCKICLCEIVQNQPNLNNEYHYNCLKKLFGSKLTSPYLDFDKKSFRTITQQNTKGLSISGAQIKLSAKIVDNKIVPTALGGEYILKPSPYEYEQTAENEHVSMLIGESLGIETPPLGLVKFSDGEAVYIIKRFDRESNNKLHQEDLSQIMGIQRERTGEYKYSKSYEEAAEAIYPASGGKLTVVLKFFKRLLFNFVIGNGDFHLKNISLTRSLENRTKFYDGLTPNYDSLHTKRYSPGETEFALSLLKDGCYTSSHESYGYVTKHDFVALGEKIGLNSKVVDSSINELLKSKEKILTLIDFSFLTQEFKEYYTQVVNERLDRFKIMKVT